LTVAEVQPINESDIEVLRVFVPVAKMLAKKKPRLPETRANAKDESINTEKSFNKSFNAAVSFAQTYAPSLRTKLYSLIEEDRIKLSRHSSYDRERDVLNLGSEICIGDPAVALIHEATHAIMKFDRSSLLNDIPTITAEFLVQRQLGESSNYRYSNMLMDSDIIEKMIKYYEEKTASKEPMEIGAVDLYKNLAQYFIGITSAFALSEKIKNKTDMENMFNVFNDTTLTDAQKLEKLGINEQSVTRAINNYIQQQKTQSQMPEQGDDRR